MLYFKSCPKCLNGTIQLDSDFFGSFMTCLNCGFEKSAASVRKIDFEEARTDAEEAVAAEPVAPVVALVEETLPLDEDLEDDFYEDDDEEVVELERAAG